MDILDYTTFDDTHKAIECWAKMPEVDQAQHKLSGSREYEVYVQACKNRANMDCAMNTIVNHRRKRDMAAQVRYWYYVDCRKHVEATIDKTFLGYDDADLQLQIRDFWKKNGMLRAAPLTQQGEIYEHKPQETQSKQTP